MAEQTTLGGGTHAEDLAEKQQQASIAEFFSKNKQMLGFGSRSRALVTATKEAVDNALDATEDGGILPDIRINIEDIGDYYRLTVEDNGPGITKNQLSKVFGRLLYGSRFHKREQRRGQQGIGISAAVLYSQMTSGKPVEIISRPKGRQKARRIKLLIDEEENEADIQEEEEYEWDRDHGTRITMEMEANMRGRKQLHRYIRRTAVVNPHARIQFDEPGLDEPMKFDRATDELPPETDDILPHPHGTQLGELMKMLDETDSYSLSGFLQEDFTRVGPKTASNILNAFRDRWKGREGAWYPPDDSEAVIDAIHGAVQNKKDSEEEAFAEAIWSKLSDNDAVSRTEVETIVTEAAEEVEDGFTTRFGSTVREKTSTAIWEVITDNRENTLETWFEQEASDRKDRVAIHGLAARTAIKFDRTGERDRATQQEVRDFIDSAAELTEEQDGERIGETAREKFSERLWDEMTTVSDDVPKVSSIKDDRDLCGQLRDAMHTTSIQAPPTDCLSPITEEKLKRGIQQVYPEADFYSTATRDASVHSGEPFIIEAGVAFGEYLFDDEDSGTEILRFANRVPLVYQRGACAITDVVKNINWRNYKLNQKGGRGIPNSPAVLVVHVASTNVPFTSESKDALANVEQIEKEVERALRIVGRDLKSHLKTQQNLKKRRKKQEVLTKILPDMGEKLSSVTGREMPDIDASVASIMNNIFVTQERDGSTTTIKVINHANSGSATPNLEATVDDEPEVVNVEGDGTVASVETVKNGDEWMIRWKPTVGDGEQASLQYDGGEASITVEEVKDERVTIEQ